MRLLNVYYASGTVVSIDNTKMGKTGLLHLRNLQSREKIVQKKSKMEPYDSRWELKPLDICQRKAYIA